MKNYRLYVRLCKHHSNTICMFLMSITIFQAYFMKPLKTDKTNYFSYKKNQLFSFFQIKLILCQNELVECVVNSLVFFYSQNNLNIRLTSIYLIFLSQKYT